MAQPTATLDVDGVILQSREDPFFEFTRREKDVIGDRELYRQTHNWDLAFGQPKEVITQWFEEFADSPYCPPLEPVPGATAGLRALRMRGVQLGVVSQRPVRHEKMLAEAFGRLFVAVEFDCFHFVNGGSKHAAVRRAGSRVHVEDSLHMARNVATEAGVPVIVFPHPYNWHHSRHSQLVYTEAHALAGDGMQFADWVAVWMAAWREIPHLVADLVAL